MTPMKSLTIIVPTYNMQEYLQRCLDSLIVGDDLMEQLEVLVINDGSKDRSSEIAHEYEQRFPQTFRVVDKENGNYGSCVNRGLAEAKGKYVKVLDADDWFDTAALTQFLSVLEDTNVDLVLTPFEICNTDRETVKFVTQDLPVGVVLDFASFPPEQICRYSMHMIAYRTMLLREIGYVQTEGISYTDTEWTHIPQYHVRTFVWYPFPVYKYLIGREGQSMDNAVLVRNIWKYEIICRHLVAYKKQLYEGCNRLAEELNSQQIDFLASSIYRYCLVLSSPSRDDLTRLKQFDSFLKENCRDVYERTESLVLKKRVPIRYVHMWRRLGVRLPLDFSRELYRLIKYGRKN